MAIAAAMLVAAVTPAVVSAQPKLAFGFNVDCTDGSSFFVNFGPPKNQGTAMHILGTHSILTSNGFEITTAINGELVDDAVYKPRGLTAVDQRGGGVTCQVASASMIPTSVTSSRPGTSQGGSRHAADALVSSSSPRSSIGPASREAR